MPVPGEGGGGGERERDGRLGGGELDANVPGTPPGKKGRLNGSGGEQCAKELVEGSELPEGWHERQEIGTAEVKAPDHGVEVDLVVEDHTDFYGRVQGIYQELGMMRQSRPG